jgi:hypothetical protein
MYNDFLKIKKSGVDNSTHIVVKKPKYIYAPKLTIRIEDEKLLERIMKSCPKEVKKNHYYIKLIMIGLEKVEQIDKWKKEQDILKNDKEQAIKNNELSKEK